MQNFNFVAQTSQIQVLVGLTGWDIACANVEYQPKNTTGFKQSSPTAFWLDPLEHRPGMNSSLGSDYTADQDEDERNANAQLIADLQLQVQRAEHASEQYRKHLELMQERLDKSTNDLTLAEERDFQRQTQLDRLQAEVKDTARQRRELDIAHESEMRMLLQERERQASREAGLQSVINRLNETLRNKEHERLPSEHQAVSSGSRIQVQEPDFEQGDTTVQIVHGKDSTIEQLRLELADLHLKAAEQELSSQSHLQALEKRVTELRVQNARLQEENESFQMLLSEKTLKGDFMAESREMSTLAEELETAIADPDTQTDICRKLEAELKAAREENKGLTLYIDKIIGRLLQHDGFEHIVDNSDQGLPSASPKKAIRLDQVEKALPPSPGEDSVAPAPTAAPAAVTSAAQTLLKRAGSLMSRSGNVRSARPMSIAQPLAVPSSANENPVTAPSIPLSRGHRRSRSDQPSPDPGAAVAVQQMNRGSPLRAASGGQQTPGFYSLPDPFLTPKGEEQCNALKNTHFPDQSRLSLIAASPLRRTLHTAFLTFQPALKSKGYGILAVPDTQETSDFPCDTGSDLDNLREFIQEQGWPVDLSLLSNEWNVKTLNGRYSPHGAAVAERAKAARQLLRRKARELVAAGQPDAEIVVVTHGGFLHYFTNDWENAAVEIGTGWMNCETRSYTFKRGLSHPMPDPESQKKLFIEAMEGWEAQGIERPDKLEIPTESIPTETVTPKVKVAA
ncbi:hypothetical protein DV738_g1157, partial [Chaetothyriales sp. CBS 135597]